MDFCVFFADRVVWACFDLSPCDLLFVSLYGPFFLVCPLFAAGGLGQYAASYRKSGGALGRGTTRRRGGQGNLGYNKDNTHSAHPLTRITNI